MATELPIRIATNVSIEDIEQDIRDYKATETSADELNLAILTAAKIIEAALDRQTAHLSTIAAMQTTIAAMQTTIADKQTTIAAKQTTIADKQTVIADKQTVIADKQTAMETYQKRMKELGETSGIRTITPTELVGLAKMYQVMIEQGKILDDGENVSSAQQANAKQKYKELTRKVEDLIRDLGPPNLGF